jgi:hypothetical protein
VGLRIRMRMGRRLEIGDWRFGDLKIGYWILEIGDMD